MYREHRRECPEAWLVTSSFMIPPSNFPRHPHRMEGRGRVRPHRRSRRVEEERLRHLSQPFDRFQRFVRSHGQRHYAEDQHDWNMDEMLATAALQFEGLITSSAMMPEADQRATRLAFALLHQGKSQLRSPKRFCELSDAVSPELSDYLAFALTSKLGVVVPDRLDQMLNGDIRQLCEVVWVNFDGAEKPGFLAQLKLLMVRFSQRPAGI